MPASLEQNHEVNAADFGFLPTASGLDNARALQKAVDQQGTVIVSRPGVYDLADTVLLPSHTDLIFNANTFVRKVDEQGPFTHVFLNKGALTRTVDKAIRLEGLTLIVNDMDVRTFREVFGLHGHVSFFHVQDLHIERFRCDDVGALQYCIHICSFEDVIVNDVIIRGKKDGVHFGRGKRFVVSNGVFETGDDAIALNAHDYDVGNPEMGWIEDGVVEKCVDLDDGREIGFFCRIIAGAWVDWFKGMQVQKSDTVVSNGRLYRVRADADGRFFTSTTQPTHEQGAQELDGITWYMVQEDVTYTAGVRNVVFRDITLKNPRIGFSVHYDSGKFSRSYYPNAPLPLQQGIVLDRIHVAHDKPGSLLNVNTPIDSITIVNSHIGKQLAVFRKTQDMVHEEPMTVFLNGCTFAKPGVTQMLFSDDQRDIHLKTANSVMLHPDATLQIEKGPANLTVDSDLADRIEYV